MPELVLYPHGLGSCELLSEAPIVWSSMSGYHDCDHCSIRDSCQGPEFCQWPRPDEEGSD